MEIYIRDRQLNIIDIIDNATSVIWTKRYNVYGEFEIYIRATDKLINTLQPSYYVCRADDDMVCIIERITLTTDSENGDYLTVSGRDLLSILTRRIFIGVNYFTNKHVEEALRDMVWQNCIDPEYSVRKINELALGEYHGFDTDYRLNMQVTGSNLYDEVIELAKRFNYGVKITLINNKFVFDIYKGTDRSYNQNTNPYIIFSDEFSNLLNSTYTFDMTHFKNVAVIAGQGEGDNRNWETTGVITYTPNWYNLDRYETFIDARDIASNYQPAKQIGPAIAHYYELAEKGQNILAEVSPITTFEGNIDGSRTYIYKVDYGLGDIIQIQNEYGMTATAQIIEVIESEDENGHTIIPTFSEWEVN